MNPTHKKTQELLEEINGLPNLDFDKDPEFLADYANGLIVQDILNLMDKKQISQTELANMIGKSRQYVSRILIEKRNFTIKSLASFACALNCDLNLSITERKTAANVEVNENVEVNKLLLSS